MQALEFTAKLGPEPVLAIPPEIAGQLPKTGTARIIVLTEASDEDRVWQSAAYEQFMRDDDPADAVYDNY